MASSDKRIKFESISELSNLEINGKKGNLFSTLLILIFKFFSILIELYINKNSKSCFLFSKFESVIFLIEKKIHSLSVQIFLYQNYIS